MSKILVDELVNLVGTDKVTFSEGIKVSSGETIELDGATITLDTGIGLNDQLLASTGSGLKWVSFTDTNSTYTLASVNAAANDIKLNLTGGGDATGQLNQVTLTGSGSVTLSENAGVIEIAGTDSNTTYDLIFADEVDGGSATLTGSDSSADALILKGGTNITISRSSNTFTFSTSLSGTVGAPGSVTDNSIALFDGTTGSLLSDSTLVLDGSNNLTGVNSITAASNTSSFIPFYYPDQASFPSAIQSRGAFAFAQATGKMHYAAGNSWYQVAQLGDIVANTDTNYSVALTSSTNGATLTLSDSNGIGDDVFFRENTYGGIELERSGETLYFDSMMYSVSAETGGNNFAYLRLKGENHDASGNVTRTFNDDITFVGADGLSVERTDANTITFRQGAGSGGSSYTDSEAKDAAAQSLLNGSHTGISFSYDSVNKILSATSSGGGGGGGSSILYDFNGTNTTSNHVILNLVPSSGSTDTVELAGGGDTTVTWDSVNNKATIASTAPVQSDWDATSGLAQILNKPSIPPAYTLPAATTSVLGGVIPDGTTITVDANGNIAAAPGGYTLPIAAAGTLGGIKIGSGLAIDAGGVVTVASGGSVGLQARTEFHGTTASLQPNETGNLNITAYKAYLLLYIETNEDAWVRVYTDDASRTADANRSEGEDPGAGTGVIAEVRGTDVMWLTPGVFGYNADTPSASDTMYLAVTNRSGSTDTIHLHVNLIRLEA